MTRNQIEYFNAVESKRHNLASEKEANRSNRAREVETNRHNVVTEGETNRHNVASEVEINRHNVATEREATRHNVVVEQQTRDQNLWLRSQQRLESDRNYYLRKQQNEMQAQHLSNEAYSNQTGRLNLSFLDRHYQRMDATALMNAETQRAVGFGNLNVGLLNASTASRNASTNEINAATSARRVTYQNMYDQGMLRNNTLTANSQVEYQRNRMNVEKQQVVIGYLNAGANLISSSSNLAKNLKGGRTNGKSKTATEKTPEELWFDELEKEINEQAGKR